MQEDLIGAFNGLKPLYILQGNEAEFDELMKQLPEKWRQRQTCLRCLFLSFLIIPFMLQ